MTTKSILLAVPALVGVFALSTQAQVTIADFTTLPTGYFGWEAPPSGTFKKVSGQVTQIRDSRDMSSDSTLWGFASYVFTNPLDISMFNTSEHPGTVNDQLSIIARQIFNTPGTTQPNQSPLTVALVDQNSRMLLWSVAASSFGDPGDPMSEVRVNFSSATSLGGTFDYTKLNEVQIWRNTTNVDPDFLGIYTTADPSTLPGYDSSLPTDRYAWQFDSISAVPEPHQYAMLAGLGLIGFAAYRRYATKAA